MNQQAQAPIHSVGKAMELFNLFLEYRRPMSLTELAKLSGYPKSTLCTLLSSMRAYSYIDQSADGKYFLGIRMYECGRVVSSQWDISDLAKPYLERLAELTGASAVITYMGNGHIINLEQSTGHGGVRVLSEVGTRLPLHATAQGKLYLSTLKDSEVTALLHARGQQPFTPHTLTTEGALLEHLELVRQNGYAIENGEYKIGLRAACAPVWDRDGAQKYAVGVVGLFRQIHSDEFESAIAATVDTARQISASLGYRL